MVFSPLTSIQQDQLLHLRNTQLSCCILNTKGRVLKASDLPDAEEQMDLDCSVPLHSIAECNLVFAHPEALFCTSEGRKLMDSDRSLVKAIVIDECHKVNDWGTSFRKAFRYLKDLPAFFPHVPRLALSATITMEQEEDILNAMGMSDAIKIKCSPDRENIFLSIFHKESSMDVYESYEKIYQPLCDQLLKDGYKFPVTLLYMPLQHLGSASAYCRYIFGNPTLDQCTYGILCSGQNTEVKNTILMDLRKSNPRIRLVFCTSVVGMGFNSPSIDRVIHARPPRNLADYVQEFGRAGRSGQPAEAVLYFCKKDIAANVKDMNTDIIWLLP